MARGEYTTNHGYIGIDKDTSNRWYVDSAGVNTGHIRMWSLKDGSGGSVFQVNSVLQAGRWQHVAISDDGSTTRVYVDGIYRGGASTSFDYSNLPNDSILRLGAILHGGTAGYQYLNGALDDIGVWSSALTAPQVNALYNLANYPALEYDLGKVQKLFDVHGAGTGSDTVNGRTWDYATGLTTDPARLGKVFVVDGKYTVALDNTGTGVTSDLPSNLIAYWRFNNTSGTTAADSSPSGLDGTLTGADENLPTWIDGKFGGALRFGGGTTGEHVEIGSDNLVTSLSGPKTFSFWTRLSSDSSSNGFIAIDNDTSGNRWYMDDQSNNGDLRMYQVVGGSSSEVFRVEDVLNYNSNEWQHILVADDGTGSNGTRVFVDGQLAGTRDSFDYSGLLPGSVLRLGVARHSSGYQYLKGDLDDFGVVSGTLTTPQAKAVYSLGNHRVLGQDLGHVQQIFDVHGAGVGSETIDGRQWSYATGLSTDSADLGRVVVVDGKYTVALDASGAGVSTQHSLIAYWQFDESSGTTAFDSSASGLDGTLKGTGGNEPTRIQGKFGGALDFAGAGSRHVEIGSDNIVTQLSGETTIAFWTKLPTTSGSNGFISIGKDSNNRWYVDDNNRAGRVRMWQVGGDTPGEPLWETATGLLTYGQDVWQHVVLSDDGQNTRVYVDGDLRGTYATFDYSDLPNDAVLRLGARFTTAIENMRGALDDFGIWNTAMTTPQVRALYSLGNRPDINHDLGQVQALFDVYDARDGGSVRHGSLQWNYTTGLPTSEATLGQVAKADGRYTVALDDSGAGFVANAELIAHWRFDEASGSIAYDSAGTNDGTLQGASGNLPTRVEGKFGDALRFGGGGSGQQVVVGADNVVTDLAGPKTFSFWTKLESGNSSNHGFIGIDKDTSNRWYVDTGSTSVGNIRMWNMEDGTGRELFRVNGVLQNDQWQHVVIRDDGSSTSVYVDGIYEGGVEESFDYSNLPNDSILRLGAVLHGGTAGYQHLKGSLDDFGVWRVALSDPQIKALYNVGQHADLGYDLGQAQQLFNMHHDQRGGARLNGRYWVYGTGLSTTPDDLGQVLQDGHKYSLSLSGDGTGVFAPGKLLAHWTFDDGAGSVATDSVGSLHGTLVGSGSTGEWIADGRVGGALQLDSSRNQYVLAGSDNLVTNLPGEKTIAFWVRMEDGSSTSNGFIGIDNDTSGNRWYIDSGGATNTDVRSYKAHEGTEGDLFRANGALTYGQWQHVVVTDDASGSGGVGIFIDGEPVLTSDSFEFSDLLLGSVLRLGATRYGTGMQYLEGALDDFGIWSVALTEPQVRGLHEFAVTPDFGYDLGMVQQLFDHHELGPGGGELSLDGFWRWEYTDGLDTGLGLLAEQDGRYFFQLDAAGTGLTAIPEPGTLALLAFGLLGLLPLRRRRR